MKSLPRSGVYKIQNTVDGRCYIGCTTNISRRWSVHRSYLRNNKHPIRLMQGDYNRYGNECLIYSVVEICEKDYLLKRESFYIDTLKPGYNTTQNSIGSPSRKLSIETRLKMAKARHMLDYGYPMTQEAISEWLKYHKD